MANSSTWQQLSNWLTDEIAKLEDELQGGFARDESEIPKEIRLQTLEEVYEKGCSLNR